MPRSNGEGVRFLTPFYDRVNPSTVVDIGPGAGTYSEAFRHLNGARWTAIEIWEPYISTYHLSTKYDTVVSADVRECELPEADLYIAGDVLEHMPREDAEAVVRRIAKVAHWLMVSVPIVHYEQGEIDGNIHETHHHHWTTSEMSEFLGASPVQPPVWECAAWCVKTRDIP